MVPILYSADETRYITNGIGRLSDCVSCTVTEERNGVYELEFEYPITGEHFDEIQRGRIVAATHDDKDDIQPFVIYSRTVPDLRGIVTFNAHHISYKLNELVVRPFTAGSIAETFQKIESNIIGINPFLFWTDKTTVANYELSAPKNARAMLGGGENSILDVFGKGDYEFDKFTVKLYNERGVDSDVEIRYSKNLVDLNHTIDDSGSYNAIVPYWADMEGNIVMLPEEILVFSGLEPQLAYLTDHNLVIIRTETEEPIEVSFYDIKAASMDLSDAFEEMPTAAELRAAAQARFAASNAWLPTENLTIDFVQLWQTEEFKDYSALQRVGLCDTVSVYYEAVGIVKVKQKVIKTVYNVLLDRYDKIELGTPQSSLGETIRREIMTEVPTTSMMDDAIKYATDLIRGGLGGYVVMTPGPNGYPQEILIMDTPDIDTAVNVWRFNQGGLGHSSNGYQGPYSDIALTQDGRINASMITTGILNANVIRAGIISDNTNSNYWNLSSGEFVTRSGKIASLNISNASISYENSSRILRLSQNEVASGTAWSGGGQSLAKLIYGRIQFYGSTANPGWDNLPTKGSLEYNPSNNYLALDLVGGGQVALYDSYLVVVYNDLEVAEDLRVSGTKSRISKTDNYSDRLLYCYETPTPLFGDIGEAIIDEDGLVYVDIDDIFSETIAEKTEYQVFLQAEGEGTCYVSEKNPRYFLISGTPGLRVAWELKAKQKDYQNIRLEEPDNGLEEYAKIDDDIISTDSYIDEMEALLYG